MGMNVGSPSGSGNADPEPMMDINTTPLIDVMLVLIIMLIITIPIQLHSVNMDMPVAAPPSPIKPPEIKIDIDAQGQIYWAGLPVDRVTLDNNIYAQGQLTKDQQSVILIRPDKSARYESVAFVLATLQRRTITKMAIIGNEQFL